jgi:triacylglycerol esterase/lipase EstA (alpha/beta hydrolase family)
MAAIVALTPRRAVATLPLLSLTRLVVAVFGLLVAGCLTYIAASYGMAYARYRASLRLANLGRAMIKELLACLLLLPLWPFWMVLGASYAAVAEGEGEATGKRNPVILLHGFAMNRTNWIWLGRRLASRGIGPLYGTSYFSPQAVRRSALQLKRFVERVLAREDANHVDIVAHSLGGVVARYYIERLGGKKRVGRLVTIASPHRGTILGRIGLVPSAREIAHGSPLFDDLGTPSPGVAYTSIWSRADAIVQPPESASIAPAGEDRVFDDLGHLSLLMSPRVLDAVAERLRA